MDETILVKYDDQHRCTAIYKFSYWVDPVDYPGTVNETEKYKRGEIQLYDFAAESLRNRNT